MSTTTDPVAAETPGEQTSESKQAHDKIINAAVELISESGPTAASAANIASRAAVSRGVVQRHCGGKQEIFAAIMLQSQQRFRDTLSAEQFYTGTLGQRVDRFIDAAWAHYQSAEYLAVLEILLATRVQPPSSTSENVNSAATSLDLWRSIFHEVNSSDEQMLADMQIVQSMLIGMNIPGALDSAMTATAVYLRRVKQILLALLTER